MIASSSMDARGISLIAFRVALRDADMPSQPSLQACRWTMSPSR